MRFFSREMVVSLCDLLVTLNSVREEEEEDDLLMVKVVGGCWRVLEEKVKGMMSKQCGKD